MDKPTSLGEVPPALPLPTAAQNFLPVHRSASWHAGLVAEAAARTRKKRPRRKKPEALAEVRADRPVLLVASLGGVLAFSAGAAQLPTTDDGNLGASSSERTFRAFYNPSRPLLMLSPQAT